MSSLLRLRTSRWITHPWLRWWICRLALAENGIEYPYDHPED
jgi:hypothetical protein